MRLRRLMPLAICLGLSQCAPDQAGLGRIGAPCIPSLEADPSFEGFRVTETTLETGAPDCNGGTCLVNHFQGRVSCPLGQPEPKGAAGAACQDLEASNTGNQGKACCLPGSSTPATTPVCGQCQGPGAKSTRNADQAVYCTCRCGVAEGQPNEPDYPFCKCPDGFECSEIRPALGVGDPKLTGQFCIRQGTAYDPNTDQCGKVDGFWTSGPTLQCAGVATGQCQTQGGICTDH